MIDIANETLLTLEQAADRLLVSKDAVYRWITHGSNEIKLEAIKLGVHWRTSVEALQRFADRLTPSQESTPSALSHIHTSTQRQRDHERAVEKLDWMLGVRKCEACRKVIEARNVVIPKDEKLWCPDCLVKRRSATMGHRLRTFRWAAHLSQPVLAQKTGIRIDKIRAYESNETKPLDADLAKLVEVLGDKLTRGLS